MTTIGPGADAAPRIVLDTNVWLDLLVFGDPRAGALREALSAGRVVAITDTASRDEWRRVLGYATLRLEPPRQADLLAAFDLQAHRVPEPPPGQCLPRCADPDDQKFLELAAAGSARWLLSRDRALLALARRTRREGLFDILTPDDWAAGRPGAG